MYPTYELFFRGFFRDVIDDEQRISLWDLHNRRLANTFVGNKHDVYIIRGCFGGADDNYVISGSEGTSRSFPL